MKPHLDFMHLISLPFFSSLIFFPLSPLGLGSARTQAKDGRPGRGRLGGRPRRRLGGGGRLGRPEVEFVDVSGFSPCSFLKFPLLKIPRSWSIDWMEFLFPWVIHAIFLEISWLFKVCSGKNLILRCFELIQLYRIDGYGGCMIGYIM